MNKIKNKQRMNLRDSSEYESIMRREFFQLIWKITSKSTVKSNTQQKSTKNNILGTH